MGYDLPRLSPIPEFTNEMKSAIISLNGTWKLTTNNKQNSSPQNIEVPGEWGHARL